jgi:hypothetical protein
MIFYVYYLQLDLLKGQYVSIFIPVGCSEGPRSAPAFAKMGFIFLSWCIPRCCLAH